MNKSRRKLILVSLCLFMMAYGSFLEQQPLAMFGLAAIGLVILAIPTYRIWWDHHITKQADQETTYSPSLQRASPGNRLFVPAPKPRQK